MTDRTASIQALGLAGVYLISSPTNVRYLCGFTGDDAQLLVMPGASRLFTDSRYTEQAQQELDGTGIQVVTTSRQDRASAIQRALHAEPSTLLGIEMAYISVRDYQELQETSGVTHFSDISEALLDLRCVKTADELEHIYKACAACDRVMEKMLNSIRPGMTEFEVRAQLVYEIAQQDAEAAFDPIVAAGPNGAMPHATCTGYVLQQGDMLTLDFGCRIDGYCSDMTRTVALGQVDDRLRNIYDIVQKAQQDALDIARAGVAADRVDAAARRCISSNGYSENFGHGTGHGVGLQIHELPVINSTSDSILEQGMVFTIEPGIYVPGLGGVRIEDTCTTERGSLFQFTKELVVL